MPTPWDAVYKQVLQQFFYQHQISVTTEAEVGRLPRKIDIALVCSKEEAKKLALVSPFTFFEQHNLLEFKSPSERLTPNEYKRIIARSYLYVAEFGIDDLSILTVCAVTSGKPVKVLSKVPKLVRFSPVAEALYKSNDKIPFYVLVVAELPIEERNYPLLLFSKGKKRRAFLKELVRKVALPEKRQIAGEYLRLAYLLYPEDVMEVFSMSKDFPTLEENIRVIINDLGLERILGVIQPQEIAQAISAERGEVLLHDLLQRIRPQEIAEAMPAEREDDLLRALLLKRLSPKVVEDILKNDGNRKS